jgi:hypothetical protein
MQQYISTLVLLIETATERQNYQQFIRYIEYLMQNLQRYKQGRLDVSKEDERYFAVINQENIDYLLTVLEEAITLAREENELAFVMFHRFLSNFSDSSDADEIWPLFT